MGERGPTTSRGRAAVRHNAVKHGLRSDASIITDHESPADWRRDRDPHNQEASGHLGTEFAGSVALNHFPYSPILEFSVIQTAKITKRI
jgi:hypothetical protein